MADQNNPKKPALGGVLIVLLLATLVAGSFAFFGRDQPQAPIPQATAPREPVETVAMLCGKPNPVAMWTALPLPSSDTPWEQAPEVWMPPNCVEANIWFLEKIASGKYEIQCSLQGDWKAWTFKTCEFADAFRFRSASEGPFTLHYRIDTK